jgi:glyoxylase-like metal-dependent hydrolase (beta-lactamase superfamily II)
MNASPTFAIYAVKYATRHAMRHEHFYGHDPHDEPMPMDYFVWAAVSPDHTVVVDTGFSAEVAARRQRQHLRCPTDALQALGIDCGEVRHVVITHFHYDHVGNLARFPAATFILQDDEMAFWTGRHASRGHYRFLIEVDDVLHLVRENFNRRLHFVDGDEEIVPGITVHRVGGHAPGLQVVRVRTALGHVVLASDASHYYANIEEDRPFSIVSDLAQMYRAFDVVRSLADSPALVIPGHDPLVMQRFPPAAPGLEGIAVRIA